MTRKEIEEIVKNFLIEDIEVEENVIKPEATLKNDLGIDSLDFVDKCEVVDLPGGKSQQFRIERLSFKGKP